MANFDDLFTAPTATETQSDRPQLTKEEYAEMLHQMLPTLKRWRNSGH